MPGLRAYHGQGGGDGGVEGGQKSGKHRGRGAGTDAAVQPCFLIGQAKKMQASGGSSPSSKKTVCPSVRRCRLVRVSVYVIIIV